MSRTFPRATRSARLSCSRVGASQRGGGEHSQHITSSEPRWSALAEAFLVFVAIPKSWYNWRDLRCLPGFAQRSTMSEFMIQTNNLTKRFPCSTAGANPGCKAMELDGPGDETLTWFTAVDRVNLSVSEGEIIALLGPNGAGKTTTVRMLASILNPSEGWARVAGFDTVREPRRVRHSVGLLTEFPGLYLRMRADDYLAFFGELQGMSPQ